MIAIVDYGMSNMHSVLKAVEAVSYDRVAITVSPGQLDDATHIILPGVGSFAQGIRNLRDRRIDEALYRQVIKKGKPFMGICLGMHLLADNGDEHGPNSGLQWIKGRVIPLEARGESQIPHIGWNRLSLCKNSPLIDDSLSRKDFYFVHKYHFHCEDVDAVLTKTFHGAEFVSAISKGNIFATQFHPEKSQDNGLKILKNFLEFNHP